jgi:superfamily II DNA or RNA helicase
MTREELTQEFLSSTTKNFILQLPTSYGKSKLALQKVNTWYNKDCKILIVIPRLVLIKGWKMR